MHPFQPTLLTLYDATTDSPIYRANVHYFDEQLDQLEKWLSSLSKHLKSYTDLLDRLNAETQTLCSKAIPTNIDGALIDPNITGMVIKGYTNALQNSLEFKTRLICGLEETLVEPLQLFVKKYMKEFKAFRKQHVRALELYEAQLVKYSSLGQLKEPSALREEAYRLYETRKTYVQLSGQHVIHIQAFRSKLEHCLVEQFSAATVAHKDFHEDNHLWKDLNATLTLWKQWLTEDRLTCTFQLRKQQLARESLESDYLDQVQPGNDLDTYVGKRESTSSLMPAEQANESIGGSKWGYLFMKDTSRHWTRKWFYLHNGYFGVCSPRRSQSKSEIAVESRISVLGCEARLQSDNSRRFCFEIINSQKRTEYVLQAETRSERLAWMAAFEKSSRWIIEKNRHGLGATRGSANHRNRSSDSLDSPRWYTKGLGINKKSYSTTVVSTPTDIPVTLSTVGTSSSNLSYLSNVSALSTSPGSASLPSAVFLSTSPNLEANLTNSVSLTPLLVSEAAKHWAANTPEQTRPTSMPSRQSSWGIPVSLVPSIQTDTNENASTLRSFSSNATTTKAPYIVWPVKPKDTPVADVKIDGYTESLRAKNSELRQLFASVGRHEVVLEAFMVFLKKKPSSALTDTTSVFTGQQPPVEFEPMSTLANDAPVSEFGYAYTGQGFITQETFWFYSCVLMTCVNTVAIRLTDIEKINIVQDVGMCGVDSPKNTAVIVIQMSDDSDTSSQDPLVLQPLMADIDAIASMLHLAVDNAKSAESTPISELYKKMHHTTKSLPMTSPTCPIPMAQRSVLKARSTSQRHRGDSEPIRVSFELSGTKQTSLRRATTLQGSNQEYAPLVVADPDDLPLHVIIPKDPSSCQCSDHLDRLEKELNLPIAAKKLYELMFELTAEHSPSESVWERKTAAMEGHDLRLTPWKLSDGKTLRTLKYWMPVTNPIVRMKEAEVEETQELLKKEEHFCYVVQISTRTGALPYADAFIPSVRYCITWVNKSECKLACYLGVKWVKSVFVKGIVTRAALKGMGDSVQAFVRILEEAANEVAVQVDAKRDERTEMVDEKTERPVEALAPFTSKDEKPNARATSNNVCDSNAIETRINNASAERTQTPQPPSIIRTIPFARRHAESDPINRNGIQYIQLPSFQKPKTQQQRPAQKSNPENNPSSLSKTVDRPSWLVSITTWMPTLSLNVIGGVMGMLTLLVFSIWLTQARLFATPPGEVKLLPYAHSKPLGTRAVYLRDLEQGVLKNAFQPPFYNSQSFQRFILSRQVNATSYTWSNMQNYRLATDLHESRQRLAMMRHDMLMVFQHLNTIDSRLVENEYHNWLLDHRQRCQHETEDAPAECDEIHHQLGAYFT